MVKNNALILCATTALLCVVSLATISSTTSGGVETIPITFWDLMPTEPCAYPPVTHVNKPFTTAVGGLVDTGVIPFDPFYGKNMERLSKADFAFPWTFGTAFNVPEGMSSTNRVVVVLEGISYKGVLTVNGKAIADENTLVGPFRTFEFDITDAVVKGQQQLLNITLTRMKDDPFHWRNNQTDLGMSFYDWAPHPPDLSMGVWRPAKVLIVPTVETSPAVTFDGLVVDSRVTQADETDTEGFVAFLNVSFVVRSWSVCDGSKTLPSVWLNLGIDNVPILHKNNVDVPCGGETRVTFSWQEYRELVIQPQNLKLWWPWQMGAQHLYTATAGTVDGVTYLSKSYGIREVTQGLTNGGALQIYVNGIPIQFRGAGWAPDLFLRLDVTKLQREFTLIRDMNLNGIRLEGQMLWEEFYQFADQFGIMIIPGIGCCDGWQHWARWEPIQYTIATSSIRDIARRLAHYPSVISFLFSSDQLPPQNVELMYDNAFKHEAWPNPTISSASQEVSNISGIPGVKMVGPYSWEPPTYWLRDGSGLTDGNYGGAWGFLTEGGPGEAPMTINSWKRTVPAENLWNESAGGSLDSWWNAHMGCPYGHFRNLTYYTPPLNARYGEATNAVDYLYKSQAANYEGIRSMFESYSRNKHVNATGLVQWMMNNALPTHLWHLYDFYLVGGGGYYGAKRALERVHVMMSYNDGSIWIQNNVFADIFDAIDGKVEMMGLDGRVVFSQSFTFAGGLPSDASDPVGVSVPILKSSRWFTSSETYFVKITWVVGDSKPFTNWYWLSPVMDVLDFDAANYNGYRTPCKSWANFTQLNSLPPVQLTVGKAVLNRTTDVISVTVSNNGTTPAVAFMVYTNLVLDTQDRSQDVAPQMWNDNFFSLAPGETKQLSCDISGALNLQGQDIILEVSTWNSVVGASNNVDALRVKPTVVN